MFCSIIIPTIGRASLPRAVNSVLDQSFPHGEFEIIVVNDSGSSLPDGGWQNSDCVQIINTNKRERRVARNAGAASAKGTYLCFLDDDDWLLPGALMQIWELSQENLDAVWLYGGINVVDEEGNHLGYVNSGVEGNCFAQIMGGAWAPLQTSFMRADTFFRLGGFDDDIKQAEDDDLCRRFALAGSFAYTDRAVACLSRGIGWETSTNYDLVPEFAKISRDRVLSMPGAIRRLLASIESGYWHGRVVRILMSTVEWNLRTRRWLHLMNRGAETILLTAVGGRFLLTRRFWEGLRTHHAENTLYYLLLSCEQTDQE
jgi:glycosyltransferase involved in cell wall biosynthesis